MEVNLEFESELALKAVSLTSEVLSVRPDAPKINIKDNHKDIVTEFDVSCEAIIHQVLSKSAHAIIGEEGFYQEDKMETLNGRYVWFVDPIDGTSNFTSGLPLYASSVGLVYNNDFLVGAVSVPPQRELFFTYGTQGSYLNGRILKIQDRELKSSIIAVSFSNAKHNENYKQIEYELFGKLNEISRSSLRLGSAAVNICYTADSRLHVACGFNAKLWDIAGGLAIAKQAGCRIYLDVNKENLTAHYVVGAPTAAEEVYLILNKKGYFNENKSK